MLDFMALKIILLVLTDYSYSFKVFTLRNFVFHYSIILVILLFLRLKLAFPPLPLIILLIRLCLVPLFYNFFRVDNSLLRSLFVG